MSTLPFPAAVLDQHAILLGKTRSGKSSKLRLIVEYLLDHKKPVGIIDPKGDWWGIKSSADGKHAGYEVVIFGGKHADVPIDQHSGAAVAELVAAANRPYLIDLKGWRVGERTRFFIDFARTLFERTRGYRWLVIDECHNIAPQGRIADPQSGEMLHWANRLASEASGLGLILLSASQRPQKVHKDYVTSHETLFALRVVHKLDRDADKDWIDGCGDPAKGKEMLDSLAQMPRTQGWVWSPEIGFGPKLIDFPMFKTYDSFKPQVANSDRQLKGWASVDLDEVKQKLAAVIEKKKADDPTALRAQLAEKDKEIRRLEGVLTAKPTAAPAPDRDAIAAAEQRGFEQAKKKFGPAIGRAFKKNLGEGFDMLDKALADLRCDVREALSGLRGTVPDLDVELTFEPSTPVASVPPKSSILPKAPPQLKPIAANTDVGEAGGRLTPALVDTLGAFAWWAAIGIAAPTRAQLGAMTRVKPGGSTMRGRLAALSTAGLIDYPSGSTVRLTNTGEAAAPAPDTSASLIETIRASLSGSERETFDAIPAAPASISRGDLGAALEVEPNGSTMRGRLAALSNRELIQYSGPGLVARQDWVA